MYIATGKKLKIKEQEKHGRGNVKRKTEKMTELRGKTPLLRLQKLCLCSPEKYEFQGRGRWGI